MFRKFKRADELRTCGALVMGKHIPKSFTVSWRKRVPRAWADVC